MTHARDARTPSKPSDLPDGLLDELVESMADGFSALDEQGRHILVNEKLCAMTGLRRDELLGVGPPHPYWPPEQYETIQAALARTMTGDFGPFELMFMHKSGTRFPVLVSPAQVEGKGGRHVFATVKDISKFKQNERRLADIQDFLETMLRAGDIASWDWHLDDGGLQVSDSYFTLLGYRPDAWLPSYEEWARRVHPDDIGSVDHNMQLLRTDARRMYDAEYRMRDANGEWRWMLARGYVTERAEDGSPTRITGTQQDIHRLKTQEEQLRQFQKMEVLGQLTGGIAHDLNNILAIAYGNLDLLELEADEKQLPYIPPLFDSLERAKDLASSLVRYSRKEPPHHELIDANEFAKTVCERYGTASQIAHKLVLDLADEPCTVRVDPSALENALLNLLINARDATQEAGDEIRIQTVIHRGAEQGSNAQGNGHVTIRVSDDGCGMPRDVAARALDPLFTTKAKGHGTGLGLAMVNKFAATAGGSIDIYSVEGSGTTVEITLPHHVGVPVDLEQAPESVTDELRGTESILIVDDESELLATIQNQLEFLGYRVTKAENPRNALFQLQETHYDLLLTDLVMPYTIDGAELAERAHDVRPDTRLLFMTGYADEPAKERVQELGPVLNKPFTLRDLARKVRALLDGK